MPKTTKSEKVTSDVKPVVVEKETKKTKSQKGGDVAPIVEVVAPVVAAPVETKKSKKTTAVVEAPKVVEPVAVEPVAAPVKSSKKKAATVAPVEVAPVVAPVEADAVQEGGKKRVRYFRCLYSDDTFGRFSGFKPKQAAGKALTSILRQRKEAGLDLSQEVEFSMVECTRGGSHKVSQYTGKRVKLEKPVTVTIKTSDDKKKEINYNFTNKISKVKSERKPKAEKKAKGDKKVKSAKKADKKAKKADKKVTVKGDKKVAKKATVKKADA